jgi:hypothetical protein
MDTMTLEVFPAIPSYLGLQHLIVTLISLLGETLWRMLLFLGPCFARIINGFFFALLIGPAWLIERFSYRSPNSIKSIRSIETSSNSSSIQETMEKVSNQAGKDGIPSNWVTIRLCHTDEISEFKLDQDTARTQDGVQSGEIGEWEEREMFVTTREEIDKKVQEWLKILDA